MPNRDLNILYTPQDPNYVNNDIDNFRRQFEADLSNYQTAHDADASKLANFVFAVSAAIQCENLSASAGQAGITFPVETGDGSFATLSRSSAVLNVCRPRHPFHCTCCLFLCPGC